MIFDYFDQVGEGIKFLIAFGSIMGLLGFIFGLLIFIFGGSRMRYRMLGVIIGSLILLTICGFNTGSNYFRIYI